VPSTGGRAFRWLEFYPIGGLPAPANRERDHALPAASGEAPVLGTEASFRSSTGPSGRRIDQRYVALILPQVDECAGVGRTDCRFSTTLLNVLLAPDGFVASKHSQ